MTLWTFIPRFWKSICVIPTALVAAGSVARGQASSVTLTEALCARCTLNASVVTTLRTPTDSAFYLHFTATLARNERGQFFATPLDNLGTLAVFDSAGRFLKSMGRVGLGPGEFRLAQWSQFTTRDTIIVHDIAVHRLSIFSPEGRYLQTIELPGYIRNFATLGNGRFLLNGSVGTARGAGHPLHIINGVGTVVASFGNDGPVRPNSLRDILRKMAIGPGTIWSAPTNAYRIDQWSFTGEKRRSLVRIVPWFVPYRDLPPGRYDQRPPNPDIRGIQQDAQGRLYVFISVPDQNWKLPAPARSTSSGRRVSADSNRAGVANTLENHTQVQRERFYDTIVEVLDPVSAKVLFSRRFDETLVPMSTAGWAYRYRDDSDLLSLEVFRLSFVTPTPED